jgi:membrane dipeptidase
VSLSLGGDAALGDMIRRIAEIGATIRRESGRFLAVRTVADIHLAKASGRLGLLFHIQDTRSLEDRLEAVQVLFDLGVRHLGLTYNSRNSVGDGCTEPEDAGLSRFGRSLVAEMNRVGMVVDLSHGGYRTTMEAMAASARPVIFSHSNADVVYTHYRNIKDDQIRACAQTGGVVGVNGLGAFLGDNKARSETIFRHIDHLVTLVGPQHVGLGLDYVKDTESFWNWVFKSGDLWPLNQGKAHERTAFAGPEQIRDLAILMLDHGYGTAAVHAILGGNWLRIFTDAWAPEKTDTRSFAS